MGIIFLANLTIVIHLLSKLIHPNFDGVILALEDIPEAPCSIDRLLTQYPSSGALAIEPVTLAVF